MKNELSPLSLVGRMLYVYINGKSKWCGFRLVKCVKVKFQKKTGAITEMTVANYSAMTERWNGPKVRLQKPSEWSGPCCGVLWRKKTVPVREWLDARKAAKRKKSADTQPYRSALAALKAKRRGAA